jgi:sugar-phosphatase
VLPFIDPVMCIHRREALWVYRQNDRMVDVFVIAGAAGSGKTTFGRALAQRLAIPLLDLDEVTAPLVAAFRAAHPELDEAGALSVARDDRYRELRRVAVLAASTGASVILTAPFTSEISSPERWRAFADPFDSRDAVHLIWLEVTPEERLRRMRVRGASRDARLTAASGGAVQLPASVPPVVGHLSLDALLTNEDKVCFVMSQFVDDSRRR